MALHLLKATSDEGFADDEALGQECLQAALRYLDLGWCPLSLCPPDHEGFSKQHTDDCRSPGKRPWHPWKAFQEKCSTRQEILDWWKKHPSANVGLALGPVSGLLRVDVDGPAGEKALAKLSGGDLPETLEFSSGRGRGLLYRIPEGAQLRTTSETPKEGEEIRFQAKGAQTVLPPSRHASGQCYAWKPGQGPEEIEAALAPPWLIEQLKVTSRKQSPNGQRAGLFVLKATSDPEVTERAIAYLAKCPPALSGQGGHNQTLATARSIVWGFDLGAVAGFELLSTHYNPRCEPPWSDKELRHKCEEADTKPFDKPRGYLLDEEDPGTKGEAGYYGASANGQAETSPEKDTWPEPPAEAAYHGLAGEVVRLIEPSSESDPVAILAHFLLGFGNLVGRGPFALVEDSRHHTNEFCVMTGRSSKARKGTAWKRVRKLLHAVETRMMKDAAGGGLHKIAPLWAEKCVQTGLSSGEGLVHALRDPVTRQEKVQGKGKESRTEEVVVDAGVKDKRLFAVEEEFAGVLKQISERHGNTLSVLLRQAWDNGELSTLTKNNPGRATGVHLSVIGHITEEELRRCLTSTESANGFANRFLWVCVKRSKVLPEGGPVDRDAEARVIDGLVVAVNTARKIGLVSRDEGARALWRDIYQELSEDRPGLAGAVTGRAEAHVLRLSLLYAMLDCSGKVGRPHLEAAKAVWDYCARSVRYLFGDSLGDPVADGLLQMLRASPDGMSRWDITNAFGRHQTSARLSSVLALLHKSRLARRQDRQTGGRPEERWYAVTK